MKLDLYIPGLLAAPARLSASLDVPAAPALDAFVQRARVRETARGRYGYLAEQLAMQHAPLAALAWLGATGSASREPLLLATPVHFKAGMSDLVLFAGPGLQVTDQERAALGHDIAAFFGNDPAMQMAGGQLFLRLPPGFDVSTTPLHDVAGGAVREQLPRGAGAKRAHAWMNELQMFLHGHRINLERQAAGLPPLNGIWFWGEGELPPLDRREDVTVFAGMPAMRGLGLLLGEARDPIALEGMLPASGHHVVEYLDCLDAIDADDINGWQSAVKEISQDILQPVLDWLSVHRDAEAVLYAGDGTARNVRGGRESRLRRAFRRKVALQVTKE